MNYIYFTCVILGVFVDQRLFYLLNKARHRVYKHADQRTEDDLGISITQLGALMLIKENEGCLLKDMAVSLNLNNSALTGLANRMAQNGLIERRPCPNDGRASRMFLTELGREKVQATKPLIKQLNQAMTAGFTDEEIAVVIKFLNHLLTAF